MQMRTLVDTIMARCQALGIKNAEMGDVDSSAVELAVLHVLQGLADSFDWEVFTAIGDPLFVTQPGVRTYALPGDFQRFLLPKDRQTDGLFLRANTNESLMTYRAPVGFRQQWATTNGQPQYYTLLAGPSIQLDPPPDTNGGADYQGVGVYVRTITTAMLDGNVPLLFPGGLVEMTVSAMALDASHAASQMLLAQGEQARGRLVNAHARMAQQFHLRTGRVFRVASMR